MGYDSCECLFCYCNSGGNSDNCDTTASVCRDCFIDRSGPLRGRARLDSYVEKKFNQHCDFCNRDNQLVLYKVSLCDDHMPKAGDDTKSDCSDHDDDISPSDCDDGKCRCVRCPSFIDSLLDKFEEQAVVKKLPEYKYAFCGFCGSKYSDNAAYCDDIKCRNLHQEFRSMIRFN